MRLSCGYSGALVGFEADIYATKPFPAHIFSYYIRSVYHEKEKKSPKKYNFKTSYLTWIVLYEDNQVMTYHIWLL